MVHGKQCTLRADSHMNKKNKNKNKKTIYMIQLTLKIHSVERSKICLKWKKSQIYLSLPKLTQSKNNILWHRYKFKITVSTILVGWLVRRKILSQILIHQGLILVLVCPMIHKHWINRRKDKISWFTHIGTFNKYIIYIQKVLTRIYKGKMCTYYKLN